MVQGIQWKVLAAVAAACAVCGLLATTDPRWLWALVVLLPALGVGLGDILQTRHSVLRNHPILGRRHSRTQRGRAPGWLRARHG